MGIVLAVKRYCSEVVGRCSVSSFFLYCLKSLDGSMGEEKHVLVELEKGEFCFFMG